MGGNAGGVVHIDGLTIILTKENIARCKVVSGLLFCIDKIYFPERIARFKLIWNPPGIVFGKKMPCFLGVRLPLHIKPCRPTDVFHAVSSTVTTTDL